MTKIYTKTGDEGETGLVSGKRVSKSNFRLKVYGDVDELNSVLGLCVSSLKTVDDHKKFQQMQETLLSVQSLLFSLGSNLACEKEFREKYQLPQLHSQDLKHLEMEIDNMESDLNPLKHFVLPGGALSASHLHLARTVCRRVERKLADFALLPEEALPGLALGFINRLSDYLFVAARFVNHSLGADEIIWKGRA